MRVCVKMMSKGSKEALTVLIVTQVKRVKVVFAAFTQSCIQSTQFVTQIKRVKSGVCGFYTTLHTEYSIFYSCRKGRKCQILCTVLCIQDLSPLQGEGYYLKAFRLVGLAVHHQSVRGGSFVNFLRLFKLQG